MPKENKRIVKEELDDIIVNYLILAKNYDKCEEKNKRLISKRESIENALFNKYDDNCIYEILNEMEICLESGLFNEEKYKLAEEFMIFSYNSLTHKLYYSILVKEKVYSDQVTGLVEEGIKCASKDDGSIPEGAICYSYYSNYIDNVVNNYSLGEAIGVRMKLKEKVMEGFDSSNLHVGFARLYSYLDDALKEKVFKNKFGRSSKEYKR